MTGEYYEGCKVPEGKKVTCQICHMGDFTGTYYPSDLDDNYHHGFTIGKGKKLYWLMIWHPSGHVTVIPRYPPHYRRWMDGGTQITIHFK